MAQQDAGWPLTQSPGAPSTTQRLRTRIPAAFRFFALKAEATAKGIAAEARLLTDASVEGTRVGSLGKVWAGSAPSRESLEDERTLFREWGFPDCWITQR
jgi:hypothetical protein